MTQRKTQTPEYWREEFFVSKADIEHLYNLFLESNEPRPINDLGQSLVLLRCQEEESKIRSELQRGRLYQPQESYEVGEQIVFPRFNYAVASVLESRPAHNPQYGDFTSITVQIEGEDRTREFATAFFAQHPLNLAAGQSLAEAEGLAPPQELYRLNREFVLPKLEEALRSSDMFVNFNDKWLPRELLVDIHDGVLNIVDAAIDINGAPLVADSILEQIDLPKEVSPATGLFSLNYVLHTNDRFDNVGPKGEERWYLRRLEPPDLREKRRWLVGPDFSFDHELFESELRRLLSEIDDEKTPPEFIPATDAEVDLVTLVLTYPHLRAGTLPLTPKTASFFPDGVDHPVMVTLIDSQTNYKFPVWVMWEQGHVYGLREWYAQNELPVGVYLTLERTENPLSVVIGYKKKRTQREWVRSAGSDGSTLVLQMTKQAIACEYDALMIVGESNPRVMDALWIDTDSMSVEYLADIMCRVFPQISKLNPQSTVHAKTLYSVVNMICRCPPGPIFQVLSTDECFIPMGYGYWTFDPGMKQ